MSGKPVENPLSVICLHGPGYNLALQSTRDEDKSLVDVTPR